MFLFSFEVLSNVLFALFTGYTQEKDLLTTEIANNFTNSQVLSNVLFALFTGYTQEKDLLTTEIANNFIKSQSVVYIITCM